MPAINTAKVKDRRPLRFEDLKQVRAEVHALLAKARAGTLVTKGNWTLGQALDHCSTWITYSFEGPPMKAPPLVLRLAMKVFKNRILNKGFPAGMKLSGIEGGTLAFADLPLDQAEQQTDAALTRMRDHCPTIPNLLFGPMTHEQWKMLHLRHYELHLSFFR